MSEEPRPVERVYVTLGDRRWELVPTGKLTFPETRELKRSSGGMTLTEVEAGINGVDPDAWFAWLYVSIRRELPSLTVGTLEVMIGDTPIVAVIETVTTEQVPGVALPDPPASAPPSGATENSNGNASGSPTPEPSTRETSGHRT